MVPIVTAIASYESRDFVTRHEKSTHPTKLNIYSEITEWIFHNYNNIHLFRINIDNSGPMQISPYDVSSNVINLVLY